MRQHAVQPRHRIHPCRNLVQQQAHVRAVHRSALLADSAGAQPQQTDDQPEIIRDAMIGFAVQDHVVLRERQLSRSEAE